MGPVEGVQTTGGGQLSSFTSASVIWKMPRASPVAQSPYWLQVSVPVTPGKSLVL